MTGGDEIGSDASDTMSSAQLRGGDSGVEVGIGFGVLT